MRRRNYLALSLLCGWLAVPLTSGCDGGNQQVRDDVVQPETYEGENLEVGDGEVTDQVNIDVERSE